MASNIPGEEPSPPSEVKQDDNAESIKKEIIKQIELLLNEAKEFVLEEFKLNDTGWNKTDIHFASNIILYPLTFRVNLIISLIKKYPVKNKIMDELLNSDRLIGNFQSIDILMAKISSLANSLM